MSWHSLTRYEASEAADARAEKRADIRFDHNPPADQGTYPTFVQCSICKSPHGIQENGSLCTWCANPDHWMECDGADYPTCKQEGRCECLGDKECHRCGSWFNGDLVDYWGCPACKGRAA